MTLLFNTTEFWIFFTIVYTLYIFSSHRWQNRLLLAASYVFYGSWDWRFLGLIAVSTVVDYAAGLRIEQARTQAARRVWLFFSVAVNLGILGFIKYFNFFADGLVQLAQLLGWTLDAVTLHIILPVGISFYTFQTMSYTIDVYRRRIKPTVRFFDFALFVAFFPQLVAGPIERASHLLPQILRPRRVTDSQNIAGVYLIVAGLFKKVVIADSLAHLVNPVFASSTAQSGLEVLVALYAFAWQIYGDFSGYSDIARGLACLMGFNLMLNFNVPYFSKNPREFWQRRHISLSTWLRDYLYIPLGGSRRGRVATLRNLAATMLLGGLWHGAAWTFVVWGAWHGVLLIVHRVYRGFFAGAGDRRWRAANAIWIIVFFHFVVIGWLFFRADSISQAISFLRVLATDYSATAAGVQSFWLLAFLVTFMLLFQYHQWRTGDTLFILRLKRTEQFIWIAGALFVTLYTALSIDGADLGGGQEFIYFQF